MGFSFMLLEREKLTQKATDYHKLEEEKRVLAEENRSLRGRLQGLEKERDRLAQQREEAQRGLEKAGKETRELRAQCEAQENMLRGYHSTKLSEAGKVEELVLELQEKS
jgi:hypothetical protein